MRDNPSAPTTTTSGVSTTTQITTAPRSTVVDTTATTPTVASVPLPTSELLGVTGLVTIRSIDTTKRVVHLELLCVEPDSKRVALGAYEVGDGVAEFNSFSKPANPASGHVDRVSFDAWIALAAVEPVWVLRATKDKVAFDSVYTPSGPTACRATSSTSDLPAVTASGIAATLRDVTGSWMLREHR